MLSQIILTECTAFVREGESVGVRVRTEWESTQVLIGKGSAAAAAGGGGHTVGVVVGVVGGVRWWWWWGVSGWRGERWWGCVEW